MFQQKEPKIRKPREPRVCNQREPGVSKPREARGLLPEFNQISQDSRFAHRERAGFQAEGTRDTRPEETECFKQKKSKACELKEFEVCNQRQSGVPKQREFKGCNQKELKYKKRGLCAKSTQG